MVGVEEMGKIGNLQSAPTGIIQHLDSVVCTRRTIVVGGSDEATAPPK